MTIYAPLHIRNYSWSDDSDDTDNSHISGRAVAVVAKVMMTTDTPPTNTPPPPALSVLVSVMRMNASIVVSDMGEME